MRNLYLLVVLTLYVVAVVVSIFSAVAAGAGFVMGVALGGGFSLGVYALWNVIFDIYERGL